MHELKEQKRQTVSKRNMEGSWVSNPLTLSGTHYNQLVPNERALLPPKTRLVKFDSHGQMLRGDFLRSRPL